MSLQQERELDDRISEVMEKQLRREQLQNQRINNLEETIKAYKMETRIKKLETFRDVVVILSAVILIYKTFA